LIFGERIDKEKVTSKKWFGLFKEQ